MMMIFDDVQPWEGREGKKLNQWTGFYREYEAQWSHGLQNKK